MGYETTIHLINITVDSAHRARAQKFLKAQNRSENKNLAWLCRSVGFTSADTLEFRHKDIAEFCDTELPDDEGFVTSAAGKWSASEEFARLLCRAGFSGSIIQHSREGDGAAWGWEFKNGRIRSLDLIPVTRWQRLSPCARA